MWGSVLLSGQLFLSATGTIRKWISENLQASEREGNLQKSHEQKLSVKKWIQVE